MSNEHHVIRQLGYTIITLEDNVRERAIKVLCKRCIYTWIPSGYSCTK